jgi:hypothetical protein
LLILRIGPNDQHGQTLIRQLLAQISEGRKWPMILIA